MDYELIVSALQKASAFDLYRLQSAIGHLLDDPLRLNAIKCQLRPGMEITYFEPQENRLIPTLILEIRRTRVAIQELHGYFTVGLFIPTGIEQLCECRRSVGLQGFLPPVFQFSCAGIALQGSANRVKQHDVVRPRVTRQVFKHQVDGPATLAPVGITVFPGPGLRGMAGRNLAADIRHGNAT